MAMTQKIGETNCALPNPNRWAGPPTATRMPDIRGRLAVLIMAIPKTANPTMNVIAANPLIATTGVYWLMEWSTVGDSLARTGARKPKFPVTAIPAVPFRRAEPHTGREGRAAPATTKASKPHAPRPASTPWQQSWWLFHGWDVARSPQPSARLQPAGPCRPISAHLPSGEHPSP